MRLKFRGEAVVALVFIDSVMLPEQKTPFFPDSKGNVLKNDNVLVTIKHQISIGSS